MKLRSIKVLCVCILKLLNVIFQKSNFRADINKFNEFIIFSGFHNALNYILQIFYNKSAAKLPRINPEGNKCSWLLKIEMEQY